MSYNNKLPGDPNLPPGCTDADIERAMGGDVPDKECPDCEGTGEDEEGNRCPNCKGEGFVDMTPEEIAAEAAADARFDD